LGGQWHLLGSILDFVSKLLFSRRDACRRNESLLFQSEKSTFVPSASYQRVLRQSLRRQIFDVLQVHQNSAPPFGTAMLRSFAYSAHQSALIALLFLFSVAATISGSTLFAQGLNSEVELFDLPQTRWPGFSDLVIDESNTPWVLANNSVYFFDGEVFREPISGSMRSGQYLTKFYGDSNRGAYLTQLNAKGKEGQLYRINSGKSKLVTTFYYDTAADSPGIYISKDGRLFNWGQRFLAVYNEGAWKRIEAKLGKHRGVFRPVISDFGSEVFFYVPTSNRLFKVDSESELSVIESPAWLQKRISDRIKSSNHSPVFACSWAGSQILVIDRDPMKLFAFDARTQKQVELNLSQVELAKKVSLQNGFELKDGSVWLLGRIRGKQRKAYFKLTPDGKFTKVAGTQALPWSNTRHMQRTKSILEMKNGSIVFGLSQDGLAIYRSEKLSRWGWRQGFAEGISHLQEGADGELWMPFGRRGKQMARVRVRLGRDCPFSEYTSTDFTPGTNCHVSIRSSWPAIEMAK